MYTDYYRLTAEPFLLTPDQRFYFDSSVHSQAMAHLTYGLNRGEGFIVITGEIGAKENIGQATLRVSGRAEDYCCACRHDAARRIRPDPHGRGGVWHGKSAWREQELNFAPVAEFFRGGIQKSQPGTVDCRRGTKSSR